MLARRSPRDLAAFVIHAIETDARGAFSVAAQASGWSFGVTIETIAAGVAPAGTVLNWLSVDKATASVQSFPRWSGGTYPTAHMIDCGAALANGLKFRPLTDSARDVLAWLQQQ